MAIIYLRSTDGSDSDNGSTWALAKATLAAALTAAGDGGTVYVSQGHAETQASAMTLTSPGTAPTPVKVICVSDANEPPTILDTTATISTTGSNSITLAGFSFVHGVSFRSGLSINLNSTAPDLFIFKSCLFELLNTTAGARILVGAIGTAVDDQLKVFENCIYKFGNVSQGFNMAGPVKFLRGCLSSEGTLVTNPFKTIQGNNSTTTFNGFDFSAYGTGKSLFLASTAAAVKYYLSGCTFGDAVSILSGEIIGQGGVEVYLDQCQYGDPSNGPRSEAYTYQGSVKTDTAIVRAGGASDGTAYSLKMAANSAGVSFISPLVTRQIPKAIDTVGSEVTVTAHIAMEEGATPLTESQCWMEVEYMGTSGSTLTSFLTDNNSTIISESSTAQTTSTETWTGFTGTPVKQQLAVTFTPQEKGFYMVRICLARVSAATTAPSVYVCPKLVVS